jgi:hypothetical protein
LLQLGHLADGEVQDGSVKISVHLSAVVDYPVYGLAGDPPSLRWMSMFGGDTGRPPVSISLSHAGWDGPVTAWITVTTVSRHEYDRRREPEWEFVWDVVMDLGHTAQPTRLSEEHQRLWAERLTDFANQQATVRPSWPSMPWSVDGVSVSARYIRFAGLWAAYTNDLSEVRLYAVGSTAGPEQLRFAATDGVEYGTDFRLPLETPGSLQRSGAVLGRRAFVDVPMHPDGQQLLDGVFAWP